MLAAAAAMRFQKNLQVKDVRTSNIIEVYFQNENPVIAAKAANALVDVFQEKHLEVFSATKSPFIAN
jgi:uncharacterized protein involved in exopolysaccharide biosynthesis